MTLFNALDRTYLALKADSSIGPLVTHLRRLMRHSDIRVSTYNAALRGHAANAAS